MVERIDLVLCQNDALLLHIFLQRGAGVSLVLLLVFLFQKNISRLPGIFGHVITRLNLRLDSLIRGYLRHGLIFSNARGLNVPYLYFQMGYFMGLFGRETFHATFRVADSIGEILGQT